MKRRGFLGALLIGAFPQAAPAYPEAGAIALSLADLADIRARIDAAFMRDLQEFLATSQVLSARAVAQMHDQKMLMLS